MTSDDPATRAAANAEQAAVHTAPGGTPLAPPAAGGETSDRDGGGPVAPVTRPDAPAPACPQGVVRPRFHQAGHAIRNQTGPEEVRP